MATTDTASIITLHQPKAQTPAERARAYRLRKKTAHVTPVTPVTVPAPAKPVTPVTQSRIVTPSHRQIAPALLTITSAGLAVVGITMNGWFAHTLGSTPVAGWCFLAIGVAADLAALALPSCAAGLWQARRRGTAVAGWLVWTLTFAFTFTAGIGFASVNITDVTTSRASRVTPAVETAKAALTDVMASRDRECAGGVGKNCRAREEAVSDRRRSLDVAVRAIEVTADPQTESASRIVAWLTAGLAKPTSDDFAMLRLILLALLPQLGGVLLMVGRTTPK